MKSMYDKNNINNKVMDIILEAATDKYAQDIANRKIECDMTAEEEEIMLNQQKRIYQNVMKQIRKEERTQHRLTFKKYAVLVASIAVIIGLAVNVSAFRTFIFKTYTNMSGTFLNIKTEKVTKESYNAISEFEHKDEIIIPGWLPPGLPLTQITDDYTVVALEYQGEDLWLTLDENTIPPTGLSVRVETNKNEFKVDNIKVWDMNGIILEIRSEAGDKVFTVIWNSDNVRYELSTNGSKIMLDAILENLKYLK